MTHRLGIIGGSGLDRLDALRLESADPVTTPYGEPSAPPARGTLGSARVVFLPRHGSDHAVAPHRINYRANLWALREAGVSQVVAVTTVGGIAGHLPAGTLVVPDQIIDYTHGRESTFFDGVSAPLAHTDFTHPFDAAMREALLRAGLDAGERLHDGATYAATQGPRLETRAEIDRMERDGAHVVGMTGMPEAVLARELGLAYAMLAVVVNPAAGRGGSSEAVSMAEIMAVAERAMQRVVRVLSALGDCGGG